MKDRRRRPLGLREQVTRARGADAHDHLDELGSGHREERNTGFACNRPGEQRLPGAGRPAQQYTARDVAAERPVPVRVAEEVDHLGKLLLRLVDAGYVGEGDALGRGGVVAARARAGKRAQRPTARRGAAKEPEEQAQQEQRRTEAKHQGLPQRRARLERLRVDHHTLVLQQIGERVRVGEGGDLGRELPASRPGGPVRIAHSPSEGALDGRAGGGDLLHVPGARLAEKDRVVGDPYPVLWLGRRRGYPVVDRQQDESEQHEQGERTPRLTWRAARTLACTGLRAHPPGRRVGLPAGRTRPVTRGHLEGWLLHPQQCSPSSFTLSSAWGRLFELPREA